MKRCKILIAVIIAVLHIPSAYSDVIILTSENPYALEVAKKIQTGIKDPAQIKHTIHDLKKSDIVVALGNEALSQANERKASKIIGSFITYSNNNDSSKSNIKSILYADPAPETLARFFDANFNKARIGIIYSPSDSDYIERIQSSLKAGNNEIVSIVSTGDTFADLNKLIKTKIDILYAGNDERIYKPTNIRFVLESLFRKRIPVISSSKSLVKAGATASVIPDEDLIISETIKRTNKLLSGANDTWPNRFIETTKIYTNKSLIKILNVKLKEDTNEEF